MKIVERVTILERRHANQGKRLLCLVVDQDGDTCRIDDRGQRVGQCLESELDDWVAAYEKEHSFPKARAMVVMLRHDE